MTETPVLAVPFIRVLFRPLLACVALNLLSQRACVLASSLEKGADYEIVPVAPLCSALGCPSHNITKRLLFRGNGYKNYIAQRRIPVCRPTHLTLSRLEEGMFFKGWLYTEIYREIMEVFNQTAQFVSETNTSEHFRAAITPPYPPFYQIILSEVEDPVRQLRGISMSA